MIPCVFWRPRNSTNSFSSRSAPTKLVPWSLQMREGLPRRATKRLKQAMKAYEVRSDTNWTAFTDRDKNACIGFDNGWLTHKSILDVEWPGIINTDPLKHGVRSVGSCPIIWGWGFAELRQQTVHARVREWTILRQPMMCRRQQSEEVRSVGPACSKCKCSVCIMSFVTGCFPWRITGCKLEYDSLEFCSLPLTLRIPEESSKGCSDSKQLLEGSALLEVRARTSSLKWSSCEIEIQ